MTVTRDWEPLLRGTDALDARAAIDDILRDLGTLSFSGGDYGSVDPRLIGGAAGISLFEGYASVALDRDDLRVRALSRIHAAVAAAESDSNGLGLFFGLTGIAWVVRQLETLDPARFGGIVEADFTASVVDALEQEGYEGVELFRGAAGLLTFALECQGDPSGSELLQHAVTGIMTASVPVGLARYWTTDSRLASARGVLDARPYVNVGVPHGVAGIVAALGIAARHSDSAREGYRAGLRWLQSVADQRGRPYRFGMTHGIEPHPDLLAPGWCYGDLATASVLAAASSAMGDDETLRYAGDLAEHALVHAPASVPDIGL